MLAVLVAVLSVAAGAAIIFAINRRARRRAEAFVARHPHLLQLLDGGRISWDRIEGTWRGKDVSLQLEPEERRVIGAMVTYREVEHSDDADEDDDVEFDDYWGSTFEGGRITGAVGDVPAPDDTVVTGLVTRLGELRLRRLDVDETDVTVYDVPLTGGTEQPLRAALDACVDLADRLLALGPPQPSAPSGTSSPTSS